MRFKLLEGQHIEGGYWTPDGKRVKGTKYSRGDIITTKADLLVLNAGARRPKFERLPDEEPVGKAATAVAPAPVKPTAVANKPSFAALEMMSLQDLQKHAEAEEIDLGKAKSKDEILKVIKAAY